MHEARLHMLARSLRSGLSLADIGTDHGQLSILAVEQYGVPKVIAIDKNPDPLRGAQKNVAQKNLTPFITCRLGDGFSALAIHEVEQAVIAGIGNGLMLRILESGKTVWQHMQHVVLSTHQHPFFVRRWAVQNGLQLIGENLCLCHGQFYVALQYTPASYPAHLSQKELYFGPYFLQHKEEDTTIQQYFARLGLSAQRHYRNLANKKTCTSQEMELLRNVFGEAFFDGDSQCYL